MNKIKKILKYDKKIMIFLNLIAIAGIISGSIFVIIIDKNDKKSVIDAVNNLFNNIKNNNFDYLLMLKNTLINNILLIFLLWIVGISVIGVIIVILSIFFKCFILSFTISSILYVYKVKGFILALIYIFPHMVINLLIFLYISSYSIKLTIILIKSILKKENLNFKLFFNNYLRILLVSLIFILFSCLVESFVTPFILKWLIKFLI